MKTKTSSPEKKIKDEIREAYAKTYPNCIFSLTNHIERLKAELKAIETALAAKDEAIRTGLSYAIERRKDHYGESRTKKGQHRGWPEENLREIERMEAALGNEMRA